MPNMNPGAAFFAEFCRRLKYERNLTESLEDLEEEAKRIFLDMIAEDVDTANIRPGGEDVDSMRRRLKDQAVEIFVSTMARIRREASDLPNEDIGLRISSMMNPGKDNKRIDDVSKVREFAKKTTDAMDDIANEIRGTDPDSAEKIDTWMKALELGRDEYAAVMGRSPAPAVVGPGLKAESFANGDTDAALKVAIDNLRDYILGRVQDGGNQRFKEFGHAVVQRLNMVSDRISDGKVHIAIPLARSVRNALHQAGSIEALTSPERDVIVLWLNQFDNTILDSLDRATDAMMS